VWFNLRRIVIICVVMTTIFMGCQQEPEAIGLDLIENNPLLVEYSDTTTVGAYAVLEDSLRTDEAIISLFGSMFDPVFGKTTSSIYTQFALSTLGQDFGTNPVCDSMKLFLRYAGFYGDTAAAQTVKVYEVIEEIILDTSYFSNQNLDYDPTLLADYTFVPHPYDTVWIDSIPFEPHLEIPMNSLLGDKILTAPASALDNNEEFKKYINGIYITTDPIETPNSGATLYMNFFSTLSRINIYYHNEEGDSLFYRLVLNSTSNARFGNYNHYDYADASQEFQQQVLPPQDTTLGKLVVYGQGMSGVKTKITFPYLMDWVKDNSIAVNEAKLYFTNLETGDIFRPPPKLSLLKILEDGSVDFIIDQYEGENYFGGYLKDDEYMFRITRYLQGLLTGGETDYGLYLLVSGGSLNAERVILGGSESQLGQIRLEMIYTRPN